jgi:ankyrin repeat protein
MHFEPAARLPPKQKAPVQSKSGDGAKISEIISSDPKAACAVDAARGDLTVLATASAAGHVEIIKALLDGGAVDTVVRGWSAACHAAYRGHAQALAALAAGLGVNAVAAPPGASMTPLLLACLKGHQTCAALILDAAPGTLSDRDPHGRTPLIVAASNGNVELIEYLVKRGAPIDDTSSEGKTALMWAIVGHKPFAVAALARLGASPEIRTKPNKEAPIQPGKNRELGDSIHDLADAKNTRDPTVASISKYVDRWVEQRKQRPDDEAPPFTPLPWVSHGCKELELKNYIPIV